MYNFLKKIFYYFDKIFIYCFANDVCNTCQNKLSNKNIYCKFIICDSCLSGIKKVSPILLKNMGKSVLVFSYGLYEGSLRQLLHSKYRKDEVPYYFLGKLLSKIIISYDLKFDYLIPIPQSFFKLYSRGFNHAEELTKSIAEEINVPILNVLELDKFKFNQADLSIEERKKNISGKFKSSQEIHKIYKKNICIIDDIYTTGSTIKSALQAIHHAGANKCHVFTVARCRF
jgi:ComF family protein